MSRTTGIFNFAANFEVLAKAPLDAKQLVGTFADLTLPGTWNGSGSVWLYNGAMVSVGSDPTLSKNGIYWLCDATNYTTPSSWVKAGSGSITGATNGLSLYNGGKTLGLGGNILSGTTITLTIGSTLMFVDSRMGSNQAGIQYSGDYSLNYTARSIVDAGYVSGKSNQVNVYCQSSTAAYIATCLNDFIGAYSGSTICLPNVPKPCQRITIADVSGHALDCMITINGNSKNINDAPIATINTDYGSVTLVNNGSFWSTVAFIN